MQQQEKKREYEKISTQILHNHNKRCAQYHF
jgi:hypothetical protein